MFHVDNPKKGTLEVKPSANMMKYAVPASHSLIDNIIVRMTRADLPNNIKVSSFKSVLLS